MDSNSRLPAWLRLDSDESILLRTDRMAALLRITPRALQQWADKGCPRRERGWWPVAEVFEWKAMASLEDEGQYNDARKLKADIQYREEKVKQAEIERKALEGQYLAKEEVDREWSLRVLEVKSVLMGLGGTLASQFTDADTRNEVRRVVDNEIQRALEQYSRDGYYTPEVRGNGEVVEAGEDFLEAAGEADLQPMG